jgi:hypothetical protein
MTRACSSPEFLFGLIRQRSQALVWLSLTLCNFVPSEHLSFDQAEGACEGNDKGSHPVCNREQYHLTIDVGSIPEAQSTIPLPT